MNSLKQFMTSVIMTSASSLLCQVLGVVNGFQGVASMIIKRKEEGLRANDPLVKLLRLWMKRGPLIGQKNTENYV